MILSGHIRVLTQMSCGRRGRNSIWGAFRISKLRISDRAWGRRSRVLQMLHTEVATTPGELRGYLLLPARTPRAQALQAGDEATLLGDQLRQLPELDIQLMEAGGGALRLC